ncbi:MAG: hypothetical protein ACYTAO_22680 [Planctomycetota bacterium]
MILLAPLSSQAGGYGLCKHRGQDSEPEQDALVFADANDPDYQKILALCVAGKKHLDEIKRFDMPDFRPRAAYVREMKRYGILPKDIAADAKVDVYATDRVYWRSLWYKPDPLEDFGELGRAALPANIDPSPVRNPKDKVSDGSKGGVSNGASR